MSYKNWLPRRSGRASAIPSLSHYTKESTLMRTRIRIALVAMVAVMGFILMATSIASAYCGPEFTNKSQAVAFYHTPEGAKLIPALTRELRAHGFMHGDQDFWAFLNSPNVVVVITTKGYTLSTNTSCSGTEIVPFAGLLVHSERAVLAVRGKKSIQKLGGLKKVKTTSRVVKTEEQKVPQSDGSTQVIKVETVQVTTTFHQKVRVCYTYNPFEKGYCRNFVTGKVFKKCNTKVETTHKEKSETKQAPVRTEPPPPPPPPVCTTCECQHNCPPPPPPNCSAFAPNATWSTTLNACVVNICGNVVIINGSNNTVIQEGNCNEEKTPPNCAERGEVGTFPNCHPHTCEETGTCPPPPTCKEGEVGTPPNCRPRTCQELGTCPQPPVIISVTTINDLDAEGFSENFCVEAEVPGSDTGTLVMAPRYGSFGPLGGTVTVTFTGTISKCVTYYAPTEVPPGEHDRMKVTLRDNTTGLSAPPEEQEFRIKPVPVNPG